MFQNYREKIFGASICVFCREAVHIAGCPLLEIPLLHKMLITDVIPAQGETLQGVLQAIGQKSR